jgi:hypothetical protein
VSGVKIGRWYLPNSISTSTWSATSIVERTAPSMSRNMCAISSRVLKNSVFVSNRKRFSSFFFAPVLMHRSTSCA